ncbi:F-actin-capping protein subunit beta [Savitreella phatthalungensis]
MSDAQLDAALDLIRRLKPQDVGENLNTIIATVPELQEELLSSVDQPLKIQKCSQTHRDYLLCDYNRDADSYRSPWSNEYSPALPDGMVPSKDLRKLEVSANDAFDIYRDLYYEGGVSSVYLWDLDDGFAGVVLFKKGSPQSRDASGGWDSVHVFEAVDKGRSFRYKLTSTVMLSLKTSSTKLGAMDLGGNMTRQVEQDLDVDARDPHASHVANIGRLVEDMELKMRNLLQEVYFGKTKDICNDLRSINRLSDIAKDTQRQADVLKSMNR